MIQKKNTLKVNEVTCDSCGTTYLYDKDDLKIGLYGYEGFDCPNCENFIAVGNDRKAPLFPTTFYHNEGVKLTDKEINKYVQETWAKLKYCKPGEFALMGTGDSIIFGLKFEDEEDIYVCKNYYEDSFWHDEKEF